MRGRFELLLGGLCILMASGCRCGVPPGVVNECTGELLPPPTISTDILFVIDNSRSMAEEQAKVVAELSTFLSTLAMSEVENDFQVGVITTAVTQRGQSCTGGQISSAEYPTHSGRLQLGKDLDGNVVPASVQRILRHDDPDLLVQFRLLIGQGTVGSGQEMAFEAIRRALTPPVSETSPTADPSGNLGFLRPGSRLLIVIATDEDDCSDPTGSAVTLKLPGCGAACTTDADCSEEGFYCVNDSIGDPTSPRSCQENACETVSGRAALAPVSEYIDFLQELDDGFDRGRFRDVNLAVIGPVDQNGDPSRCTAGTDEAYGVGKRYAEAVALMGDRGFIASICDPDFATTLEQIALLVSAPQVIDLPESPPDGALIRVDIQRGAEEIECKNGDGFDFFRPENGAPARIEMKDECRLKSGDTLGIRFICLG